MARLGFCGLGQMGAPMAHRLLDAGHELTVWNRSREKADPLARAGARVAETPADAARGAEGAITMLATPEAVREVVAGRDGLAAGLGRDSTLIEMSTLGTAIHEVAELLPEGVEAVDAPVLGTVPQAEAGTLRVFVGGSEEAFERWAPVLEAMGTPMRLGPLGAGASMKLVVNSTLGALMTAAGEALGLADALGLETEQVLDILSESPIGITVRSKRDKIESGTYPPNFKLGLAAKDLRLVVEAAESHGRELRLAPAARAWFRDADGAGLRDLDYSAVIAHIRGTPAEA